MGEWMRTVTDLPHEVIEDEHVAIRVSDGTRLAARLWRPAGSDTTPVPGILESIPYRRRDLTAVRDSVHHPYLAGHGYACVRLDLRGTGDSEGVLTDEYTETEHRDIEEVLAWLAAQPWCTGRTGMMGVSWGGFNALQVAARRPPSLGAIVISSFTDDRYGDDFHYLGGCMLADNLAEAGTMFASATCPPDPAVVGERWREMWRERLEAAGPWADEWLEHQRRDDYWRHASVCEDYAAVQVPVLASSGWADGYSNAVLRVLEHLDVPRKGIVGPWAHRYPHLGEPGPAIGYLQEVVRWWDRWLSGDGDALDAPGDAPADPADGPMLCAWMQESVPPDTAYAERPGRWVGEASWPSPEIVPVRHGLAPHRLTAPDEPPVERELAVRSPLSVGSHGGKWAAYLTPPDLPGDQRAEDAGSLVFDTDPLPERCEILGAPVVEVEVAADEPVAAVVARLSDVDPDGRATRVSYGMLNLTHRDGDVEPRPVEPGRRYRVRVRMTDVAQAFPAGHRVRLALSTSYWPLAWPSPRPVRLRVHTADSHLTLPVRPARPEQPPVFDEPEGAPPIRTTRLRDGDQHWTVSEDLADHRAAVEIVKDSGTVRYDGIDLEVTRRAEERYTRIGDDPTSVRGETEWSVEFAGADWRARTVTRTELSCTETDFHLHAAVDAYDGDRRTFSRNWQRTFPRDCL
jgi:uncharacterized protein